MASEMPWVLPLAPHSPHGPPAAPRVPHRPPPRARQAGALCSLTVAFSDRNQSGTGRWWLGTGRRPPCRASASQSSEFRSGKLLLMSIPSWVQRPRDQPPSSEPWTGWGRGEGGGRRRWTGPTRTPPPARRASDPQTTSKGHYRTPASIWGCRAQPSHSPGDSCPESRPSPYPPPPASCFLCGLLSRQRRRS